MTVWTKLEQQGLAVLERLESAGYEAFFVGGYVRDKVLGKPVKDIDIATSALPDEVVRLFERTIPTGLKHGTVTVMLDGTPFEVTTYRTESGYEDFRRPAEVQFISVLEEDLRRRDFTMNAMAMDRHGAIRDPFGGREDLERGLLRCVGDAEERFREDALRMMRCVRFASAYALEVDPATWQAVQLRKELLRHVAMERVRVELERMLAGAHPYRGLRLLTGSGLLPWTKEPLEWPYTDMAPEGLASGMAALDRLELPLHRWVLLLFGTELEPARTRQLLRTLTFSVKDTERIAKAVELRLSVRELAGLSRPFLLDRVEACTLKEGWRLAVLRHGSEAALDWLKVQEAYAETGISPNGTERELLCNGLEWMRTMPVSDLKELAVTGQDIIRQAGRPAGPWVSQAMSRLLRLAALERIPNTKEALLDGAVEDEE